MRAKKELDDLKQRLLSLEQQHTKQQQDQSDFSDSGSYHPNSQVRASKPDPVIEVADRIDDVLDLKLQ